jgi:hypothetical protein
MTGSRIALGPTVLCAAEKDPLSASLPKVVQQMTAPTRVLHFVASKGAGDHCEMGNRQPCNQRAYDWLENVFAPHSTRIRSSGANIPTGE